MKIPQHKPMPDKTWEVKFFHDGKYLVATVRCTTRIFAKNSVKTKYPTAIIQSAKIIVESDGYVGWMIQDFPKALKDAFVEYHRKRGLTMKSAVIKLTADFLTRHGVKVTPDMINPSKKRKPSNETETSE